MNQVVTSTKIAEPRYREILRRLLQDIDAGDYAIGDRLPTEAELCARFGVSRHTVREALRQLKALGRIDRRQGVGSVVTTHSSTVGFTNSIDSIDGLLQYAKATRLVVISVERIIVEGEQAKHLRCPPNSEWMRLTALRYADGLTRPICYTDLYIAPQFSDVIADIGSEHTAVYAMIEKRHGVRIRKVLQDIEATDADLNVATRLGIEVGDPVLVIRRRYYDDLGNLLELAMNAHPADQFRYEMTLYRCGDTDLR